MDFKFHGLIDDAEAEEIDFSPRRSNRIPTEGMPSRDLAP
jgi:hypothetical protein